MEKRRFDPTIDDPIAYGNPPGSTYREQRGRKFLVLNSLMTKAVVESVEQIKRMPRIRRGGIKLMGGRPYIKDLNNSRFYKSVHGWTSVPNVGVMNDQGRLHYDRVYYSDVDDVKGFNAFEAPIGEYGEKLAYATVQAARAVSALLNTVEPKISAAPPEYREALQITFQRNIKGALLEGTQTLAGQFALLCARKVPGFDDPMQLFDELRKQGILNAWAAHATFGKTAPKFRGESAIAQPLQVVNGRLKLTESAKEALRDVGDNVDGCPVSRRNTPIERHGEREVVSDSGINLLAEVYGQYLRYYYTHPHPVGLGRLIAKIPTFVPRITL